MTTYAIDSTRQPMRATGVVNPRPAWNVDPVSGKRTPDRGRQETTEAGVPVWDVETTALVSEYDRMRTVVAAVTVPADTMPSVSVGEPVPFVGLTVSTYAKSAPNGRPEIREAWQAEGIATPGKRGE